MKKLLLLLTLITIGLTSNAQSIIGEGERERVFFEDFVDKSDKFPSVTKSEIYLGYKDESYYIMRQHEERPYVVQPNYKSIDRNFAIKTKVKLGPVKSDEASIGLFVMMQQGLQGGLIFEINRKKAFRISKLDNGNTNYITGDPEKEGWVKHKAINGIDIYNNIEIRAYKGRYELFINDQFVDAVVEESYKKGYFGFYAGPQCQARAKYFRLYTLNFPDNPDNDKLEAKDQIEKLQKEVDSLRNELLKAKYDDSVGGQGALDAIGILEKQMSIVRAENENLKSQILQLQSSPEAGATDLIEKMTIKNSEVQVQVDSLNNLIDEKQLEASKLQDRISQLEADLLQCQTTKAEVVDSSGTVIDSVDVGEEIIEIEIPDTSEQTPKDTQTESTEGGENPEPIVDPKKRKPIPIRKAKKKGDN